MRRFYNEIFFLSFLAIFTGSSGTIQTRIVGGKETKEKDYPFIVSLRSENNGEEIHLCGGSLISKDWVLTAAHCMAPGRINKVVGGGERSDRDGEISSRIAEIIMHDKYDKNLHSNDIALLKLETAFKETSRIKYIKMEEKFNDEERDCKTIGWGVEDMGGYLPSRDLKYLDEKTIPQKKCKKDYTWERYRKLGRDIDDNILCTLPKKRMEGVCQGDSGGPTVIGSGSHHTLIGVVSVGVGCAIGAADIHSRVSAYRHWIKQKSGI